MHLLDTSVLVPCLRSTTRAAYVSFLQQLSAEEAPAISVITRFEVIAGTLPEFLQTNIRFLDGFSLIDVTRDLADKAGQLFYQWAQKGHPLPPNDLLIGSTALTRELILVTSNRNHFPFLTELERHSIEYQRRNGRKKKEVIWLLGS